KGQRPVWLIVVATLLSAWAASGAIISLMEGYQAAYLLPSGRPFLKQRGIALLLVLIAALPAIGSSALITFGKVLEQWILNSLGLLPQEDLRTGVVLLIRGLRYLVALVATVCQTALLYW